MNRPKQIGTKFETACARYLTANGVATERTALHGNEDQGDLSHPGLCFECKAGKAAESASDGQVEVWLAETERERRNRGADHGVLILKRAGKGDANAGQWWVILTGRTFVELAASRSLDAAYGEAGDDLVEDNLPPVRLLFADAVRLLRLGGYGDTLT